MQEKPNVLHEAFDFWKRKKKSPTFFLLDDVSSNMRHDKEISFGERVKIRSDKYCEFVTGCDVFVG